jgi:hypothetical protein
MKTTKTNGAAPRAAKTTTTKNQPDTIRRRVWLKPEQIERVRSKAKALGITESDYLLGLVNHDLKSPQELAAALAGHIRREDGMIPIQIMIPIHPTELVLAARRARECGETIDEVIAHVTLNGRDDDGGLLEALRDYEGKLPERK